MFFLFLSLINETIVRKEREFDERDAGFSTFARLLEAMEKEGLLTRLQQGRQWYVVAKEGKEAKPGSKAGPEAEVSGDVEHFDEEDIANPNEHDD